jgi:hypothetical protein
VTDDKKFGGKSPKEWKMLRDKVHKIMSKQNDDIAIQICSFCGSDKSEVNHMIQGPAVNICHACVAKCNQMINDDTER